MTKHDLKHAVYVQKLDGGWVCGYFNRNGKAEARRDFDTLKEAREHAAGVWMDIYHGTNNYICSYPARPKAHPEEYLNLPMRPDGSSAVDLILPHSEGHHIDGRPKMIVSLKNRPCWLDENAPENRELILSEVIRDLEKFSNENLENKLHETKVVFYKKDDEARESFKQKLEDAKTQAAKAAKDERQRWILIIVPLTTIVAFGLGRLSTLLF